MVEASSGRVEAANPEDGRVKTVSGGEAGAALAPPGGKNCPPCLGRHTVAEPMAAGPASVVGLEGALHGLLLKNRRSGPGPGSASRTKRFVDDSRDTNSPLPGSTHGRERAASEAFSPARLTSARPVIPSPSSAFFRRVGRPKAVSSSLWKGAVVDFEVLIHRWGLFCG